MLLKEILGQVSIHNFVYYRQVGLFWVSFVYLITFFLLKKETLADYIKKFLLVNIVFFTMSPFVLFQEQYFRYYGLYLFVSFVCNLVILIYNESFEKKRCLFYALLAVSPAIHYLLTWQMATYIIWKEWICLGRKNRIIFGTVMLLIATIVLAKWQDIFRWFMHLGSSYELGGGEIRGWNVATFIKPAVSVFQYLFGEYMTVLENIWVVLLFISTIALLSFGLYLFYQIQKHRAILDFAFASIVPFITMFCILEPLTLPGSTQLIAKHGLFLISWLVILSVPIIYYKTAFVKWGSRLVFLAFLGYGTSFSITFPKENWNQVVKVTDIADNKNTVVLVQGRSEDNFKFYANDKIDPKSIVNFYDTTKVAKILNKFDTISVVVSDYRAYQVLTKEQMWNTGTSSERRFSRINFLFSEIENHGFRADDSYAYFPLICFRFVRTNQKSQYFIPRYFNIKYQDLELPVILKTGDTLLGWRQIMSPFHADISDVGFYYFFETNDHENGAGILEIHYDDGTISEYSFAPEKVVYRKFANRSIENSQRVFEWHKRPLLSSSLAFPGSWLPSTGYIYRFTGKKKISFIKCSKPGVSIHLFVQK